MCGRFVLAVDEDGLLRSYVAESLDEGPVWFPKYSIAPSTLAPVVREHVDEDGQIRRTLEPARWGLHPSWAKDKGPRPINARYETVHTNGMFRGPFSGARVVVPMNGYYEWVPQADGGKQPYYVHPADGGLLHAAGVAAARKDGEDWTVNFAIITREAKDAAGQVHDRMPAYLPPEMLGEWLAPGALGSEEKADLHARLGEASATIAAHLVTHPVDRQVNSTRRVDPTDPDLIAPVPFP
jgi:putative SOS response-associated peptidase YedK